MTATQFQSAALEIFQHYWRIKAANALYRSSPIVTVTRLDYRNVPAVGFAVIPSPSESVEDAISAMNDFITRRLRRDLLFAIIAEFETRLAARLTAMRGAGEGTLGNLQYQVQKRILLPPPLIQDMDEIRERRNAMIHHGDLAHPKYVKASAVIQPRASRYLAAAALGDNVAPDEIYLAYATDVLVRYSNAIG